MISLKLILVIPIVLLTLFPNSVASSNQRELIYDDGSAEFGFRADPNSVAAVLFETSQPKTLKKVKFYIWGEKERVTIYVLNPNQQPIYSKEVVTPGKQGWFEVDIPDLNVPRSFYIGWNWAYKHDCPPCSWLGVDSNGTPYYRSYLGPIGNLELVKDVPTDHGIRQENYMVRAVVGKPTGKPRVTITDLDFPHKVKVNQEFKIKVSVTAQNFHGEYYGTYAVITIRDENRHDRSLSVRKVSGHDSWTDKLTLTAPSYMRTLNLSVQAGLGHGGVPTDKVPIQIEVTNPEESGWILTRDPRGDTSGPDFTDIYKIGAIQVDKDMSMATLWVGGSVPKDPGEYLAYVWPLDTDLDYETSGQHYNDTGADYNLRVAYYPGSGWGAYIDDIKHKETLEVENFHLDYSRGIVTTTFPLQEIESSTGLYFTAHVVYRGSYPDMAPNQGHGEVVLYY